MASDAAKTEAAPATVASTAAGAAGPARRRRGLERRRSLVGLGLALPAFAVVAVFFFVPLGWAFYISLTDWPLVGAYHYIGFANYTALVHDSVFLHSLLFTLEYTAIVTPCVFVVGYGLAMLIRRRLKGIGIFRTMYFLPSVVGLTTISFMAILELQPNSGVVDFVLSKLHIVGASTAWLASPGLALIGISVMVIWGASGMTMVISAIGSILAFNQFQIITGGGPGTSTTTVVQWIYEVGFSQFHLGYATAMSIVLLVIVVAISATQFVLLRDRD